MKLLRSIATPSCITLVFEKAGRNSVVDIPAGDFRFPDMMEAVRAKDEKSTLAAFHKKSPVKFSASSATLKDGTVVRDEKVVRKMREAVVSGRCPKALAKFHQRLEKNPDRNVRDQLFSHIEHDGVTLTPDGRIILYKRVRDNLASWYDGNFKYVVGSESGVPRDRCLKDPHESCGYGLHACPRKRVSSWYSTGPLLELIIDPEHVTNVPTPFQGKVLACKVFTQRIVSKEEVVPQSIVEEPEAKVSEERGVSRLNYLTRTLKSDIMQVAGLQSSKNSIVVVVPDPRSRAFYVAADVETLRHEGILKRPEPFFMEELGVCHDHYTAKLGMGAFYAAHINPSKGNRSYTVKLTRPGVLEVRPA